MPTLEEMKKKIKNTKKTVITKTKEKMQKIKEAAKEELSDKAVKVATVATMATGFAGTANAQSGNVDGSTQMAKELNYEYAHNNNFHFRPITESERAMLEGSTQNNGGGRTASFTQQRQQMAVQQAAGTATRGYATGPVYRNVQLEFSPTWSDGLKPGLIAFTNPTEYGKEPTQSYIYYYKQYANGTYNLESKVTIQTAQQRFQNGTYQYIVPHDFIPAYGMGGMSGGNISVDVGHGGVGVNVGGIGRNGAGRASVRVGRGGVHINVGGVIRGGRR